MKYILLNSIRLYWRFVPETKRRKCIFRKSCSNYVFEVTNAKGFREGIKALKFRIDNCRSEFDITLGIDDGQKQMILRNGSVVKQEEIAQRLI